MEEKFLFRNLIVWQKAMKLTRMAYAAAQRFPVEERYALADQLRRAASSIPSNIAEGNGRASNKDYAHFLAIARGSLYETITQIDLAKDLGYIGVDEKSRSRLEEFYILCAEVGRILTSMLRKYGMLE